MINIDEDSLVVACGMELLERRPDGAAALVPAVAGWVEREPLELALRSLARGRKTSASLVMRAKVVLGVEVDGRSVSSVARELGVTRDTVRLWAERFRANASLEALEDWERSGRPARITWTDQAAVLALSCRKPADLGRHEGKMFQFVIVEEAAKAGHVMSRSSVQRILATAEVKPYLEKYYLFSRQDDEVFIARRDDICDLYTRQLPADEVVVCFDEKTGVGVRGTPKKTPHGGRRPAKPGEPGQIEQHYVRHGSRTLVGAVRPDTGVLVAAQVYPSGGYKTEQTIEFLKMIRTNLPEMRVIHLVEDNGATHGSAEMKRFLESEEGKVFQIHRTPVHASWLNLAENFLSRFSRRFLHGKRWDSLESFDLDMAGSFVAYQDVAKPMRWRYNPSKQDQGQTRRRSAHPKPPSSESPGASAAA